MSNIMNSPIKAINLGVENFSDGLQRQGVRSVQVAWRPPADARLVSKLRDMAGGGLACKTDAANQKAFDIMMSAEPVFIGIRKAKEVVPGFRDNLILHAGPPIAWERMIGAQKKGIIGGVLHEKLAKNEKDALGMIEAGEIEIGAANDYFIVGAGAGIVTANMMLNVSRDRQSGVEGYCPPFEGRVGLAVWGVYNEEVEENLGVIERIFAPAISETLDKCGGIDVKSIMNRGMQMGDDMHTRQTAAGLILVNELVPMMLKTGLDYQTVQYCIEQLTSTERWFHPLALSASMSMIRMIKGMEYATVVTSLVQNGVETGIKMSCTGEKWYLAPAPRFVGQYFSSQWGPDDAVPFMGDSTIAEECGMGAFAGAAAPGVMRLRGGGWREGIKQSEELKRISVGVNFNAPIPLLDFTGPGMAIDVRKVIATGITPLCHGGIISKNGGQIGAGAARFPIENHKIALNAYFEKYGDELHD